VIFRTGLTSESASDGGLAWQTGVNLSFCYAGGGSVAVFDGDG